MTQTFAKLKIVTPKPVALKLGRPSLQLKAQMRFLGQIVGGQNITVTTVNGVATIAIDNIAIGGIIEDIVQRTQRVVTAAGAVVVATDDADDIIIDKLVAASTAVTLCDPALRTKTVKIIDGKSDALINNITIGVPAGKKLYGVLNGTTVIDGNGGSVELTPRQDGSGWY